MLLPTKAMFLKDVELFCKETDMKPSKFGKQAMNNSAFLYHLREGRSVSLETARRVYEYMNKERLK